MWLGYWSSTKHPKIDFMMFGKVRRSHKLQEREHMVFRPLSNPQIKNKPEITKQNHTSVMKCFLPNIPTVWSSCLGKYNRSMLDLPPTLRCDWWDRFCDWVCELEWDEWEGCELSADTCDRLSLSLRHWAESLSRSFISSSCCSCDRVPFGFSVFTEEEICQSHLIQVWAWIQSLGAYLRTTCAVVQVFLEIHTGMQLCIQGITSQSALRALLSTILSVDWSMRPYFVE